MLASLLFFAYKLNTTECDNINLYEVLNLNKYSTPKELQKSFRKATVQYKRNKHHSNRDERLWRQTKFAHEIISNPDSKQLYDTYGNLFFNKTDFTVFGYYSENELLAMRQQLKGAYLDDSFGGIIDFPIQFNLVDFIQGKTKTVKLMRTVLCTCKKGGTKCPKCRKNPYEQQLFTQTVTLPKGAANMHRIYIKDIFDTHLDRGASAIVFTAYQKEDPIFIRDGVDLLLNVTISLADIIHGGEYRFQNPDGEELSISLQGVQHGEKRRIKGKGIPYFTDSKMRGDVVITFSISFPSTLSKGQISTIEKILPDEISEYQ